MSSSLPTGSPSAASPRFAFLGECIGLTVLYYSSTLLLVTVGLLCSRRRDYSVKTLEPAFNDRSSCCSHLRRELRIFFTGVSIESSYASFPGKSWTVLLCVFRGLCFCFFVAVPCIYQYVLEKGRNWVFFTFWNIDIISMYYLFAFSASVVGLRFRPDVVHDTAHQWTRAEVFLGALVQFFFAVAAPTALFITMFSYIFLGATLDFNDVSYHLVNTLTLLVDMFLNSIVIRWEHIALMVSWGMLYLLITWSMVGSGASSTWPYDELSTDNPSSVVWYTLLYVFLIGSYLVWYTLSRIKMWLRGEQLASMLTLQSFPVSKSVYESTEYGPLSVLII